MSDNPDKHDAPTNGSETAAKLSALEAQIASLTRDQDDAHKAFSVLAGRLSALENVKPVGSADPAQLEAAVRDHPLVRYLAALAAKYFPHESAPGGPPLAASGQLSPVGPAGLRFPTARP